MQTITLSKEQSTSISNYRRMGIDIEVLDSDTIKITQSRLINGHILNQKQLVLRAKEAFPGFKVIPVVYSLDVDQINIEWIESKMEEFGIKRNDLIKQLAIDKSSLSLYLSGNRTMDKSQRAAFFFYFLTYELNRDFRESDENRLVKNIDVGHQFEELTNAIISILTRSKYIVKSIEIDGDTVEVTTLAMNDSWEGGIIFSLSEALVLYKHNFLEQYLNGRIVLYE